MGLFRRIREAKEKWNESDWDLSRKRDSEYADIEYFGWRLVTSLEPKNAVWLPDVGVFVYDKWGLVSSPKSGVVTGQRFAGRLWAKKKGVSEGIPMPIKVRELEPACDIMDKIVLPLEEKHGARGATSAILNTLNNVGVDVKKIMKGQVDESGKFDTLGPCIWDFAIKE